MARRVTLSRELQLFASFPNCGFFLPGACYYPSSVQRTGKSVSHEDVHFFGMRDDCCERFILAYRFVFLLFFLLIIELFQSSDICFLRPGFFGYVTFGDNLTSFATGSDILSIYKSTPLLIASNVCVSMVAVFSFPILQFVARFPLFSFVLVFSTFLILFHQVVAD